MLIDNKFIYISLPRCASTAFHYSCILNDIKTQNATNEWNTQNAKIDFSKVDKLEIMNHIYHGHESLNELQNIFGTKYDVIAVKRDRYERFYSLYKHILSDFKRLGLDSFYDVLSKITLDELFFFTQGDLINKKKRWEVISQFLIKLGLFDEPIDVSITLPHRKHMVNYWIQEKNAYVVNIIDILITPISYWTHNNPNIIWFDFNNLSKLEEWVSNKIDKPFKIEHVNSSKHIECDITLNNEFINKYDIIYDYYDIQKNKKTLI